jgi:hypothetical protein
MSNADLYRLAGASSWLALVALVLSGIALALFFGGAGTFWGPVNDALIVVTAIALIPVAIAVARIAGERGSPWVTILTVACLAGLVLMAIGQTLLIVGRLSLDGSYVTGGIGVVPFLAWVLLVAVLSLSAGILPPTVGWLAALSLASVVAMSVIAALTMGPVLWISAVVLVAAFSGLLASLATAFGAAAIGAVAASATA